MTLGSSWAYDIELGEVEPTSYEEVQFRHRVSRARGRFKGIRESKARHFRLEARVKSLASEQGRLRYPRGVELEIMRDDLGVFEHAKQVFWAVRPDGIFAVRQIVTHDWRSPEAISVQGPFLMPEDGLSESVHFLLDRVGGVMKLGEDGLETISTSEPDLTVSGYDGRPLMHLTRTILESSLAGGFSEDQWFAKDIGLVRLVQTIDGKASMTWKLTSHVIASAAPTAIPATPADVRKPESAPSSTSKATDDKPRTPPLELAATVYRHRRDRRAVDWFYMGRPLEGLPFAYTIDLELKNRTGTPLALAGINAYLSDGGGKVLHMVVMAKRTLKAGGDAASITLDTDGYTSSLLMRKGPLTLTVSCEPNVAAVFEATLPNPNDLGARTSLSFAAVTGVPATPDEHVVTKDMWIARDRQTSEGTPALLRKEGDDRTLYMFYEVPKSDPISRQLGRPR